MAPMDDLEMNARLYPDRVALRDLAADREITYLQGHRWVGRFAALLNQRGVREGDRVALLARNCWQIPLLHLACARIGALFVPLNFRLAGAEVAVLLADCEPRVFLGDGLLSSLACGGEALAAFTVAAETMAPLLPAELPEAQPSLILYTSGTAGIPKGVLLSERNLAASALNFTVLGRVESDSAFLCDAPMFHVIGLLVNIRPAFMRAACVVISDGFDPGRTLARLADPALAVTHYFCVPQMAAALRAHPAFQPERLRGLSALFSGGAPSPAAHIEAWLNDGLLMVNGFGMSETGTVFGMPLDEQQIRRRPDSCGVSTPHVQVRVVDDLGRPCPPGTAGELQVKGANVCCGYYKRPELTDAAFTADGYLRTGDVAVADSEGYYRIVDRKKDMFISGGENVYPAEIEAVLSERGDVAECAVVGTDDAHWGEVGHLFVVPAAEAAIVPAQVTQWLRERIAGYKVPKHVTVLDALPRNGAGKIDKNRLRKRAQG